MIPGAKMKVDIIQLLSVFDEEMPLTDTEEDFCDEIYYTYDLNIDDETLTSDEKTIFKELALVTSRFSEFEQDHKKHPGAFFTATDIRRKVIETRKKLQKNFEELEKSGELR